MTDSQMGKVLKDITVIVDTREKSNKHILDYLVENKIPYIVKKLDTADYSFILPNYPELEMDYKVLIEKKNSLDEIIGNFTGERERFKREFERVVDEKIHLVIEEATWTKVMKGSYRSKVSPQSLRASLLTWGIRYNCPIWFVTREYSPQLIYQLMYYELFEKLKNNA